MSFFRRLYRAVRGDALLPSVRQSYPCFESLNFGSQRDFVEGTKQAYTCIAHLLSEGDPAEPDSFPETVCTRDFATEAHKQLSKGANMARLAGTGEYFVQAAVSWVSMEAENDRHHRRVFCAVDAILATPPERWVPQEPFYYFLACLTDGREEGGMTWTTQWRKNVAFVLAYSITNGTFRVLKRLCPPPLNLPQWSPSVFRSANPTGSWANSNVCIEKTIVFECGADGRWLVHKISTGRLFMGLPSPESSGITG